MVTSLQYVSQESAPMRAYQIETASHPSGTTVASEIQSMVGTSGPIREVTRALGWLAAAEVNLLLQGEAGTGKRVLAEAIHARSPRAAGPFFAISLSGRADAEIEAELFGRDGG